MLNRGRDWKSANVACSRGIVTIEARNFNGEIQAVTQLLHGSRITGIHLGPGGMSFLLSLGITDRKGFQVMSVIIPASVDRCISAACNPTICFSFVAAENLNALGETLIIQLKARMLIVWIRQHWENILSNFIRREDQIFRKGSLYYENTTFRHK